MNPIEAMRLFALVAETGSFTQAAERLAVPRATASNAIQALERRVGVALLQRSTRRVVLTPEGTAYLLRCRRLLDEFDETDGMFAGPHTSPKGRVQIDVPERMANLTLAPLLPAFFDRYPDIHLVLSSNARFVDLVGEGLDCVVRVGQLSDSSLVVKPVGEMHQVNCAAPGYIARYGLPNSADDLPRHFAVGYVSSRTRRTLDWEFVEQGTARTLQLPMRISVSNTETYLACGVAGLGLIQVPRIGVEHLLANGTLVEFLPDLRPQPMPISVLFAQGRLLSPRVRVVVEWVAEVLAGRLSAVG